jgi:hypothetical protein
MEKIKINLCREVAKTGKTSGNIERILLLNIYVKHHLISLNTLKDKFYPVTGIFVSETPVILALLGFLTESGVKDSDSFDSGALRLTKCLDYCENSLSAEVSDNFNRRNEYYDNLMESEIDLQAQHVRSNFLLNLG